MTPRVYFTIMILVISIQIAIAIWLGNPVSFLGLGFLVGFTAGRAIDLVAD